VQRAKSKVQRRETGVQSWKSRVQSKKSGVQNKKSGVQSKKSKVQSKQSGVQNKQSGKQDEQSGVQCKQSAKQDKQSGAQRRDLGKNGAKWVEKGCFVPNPVSWGGWHPFFMPHLSCREIGTGSRTPAITLRGLTMLTVTWLRVTGGGVSCEWLVFYG